MTAATVRATVALTHDQGYGSVDNLATPGDLTQSWDRTRTPGTRQHRTVGPQEEFEPADSAIAHLLFAD